MSLSRSLVSPAFSSSSAIGGEPGGEGSKDRHWLVSSMVVRDVKSGSKSFGKEPLKLPADRQKRSLLLSGGLGADSVFEEAEASGSEKRRCCCPSSWLLSLPRSAAATRNASRHS